MQVSRLAINSASKAYIPVYVTEYGQATKVPKLPTNIPQPLSFDQPQYFNYCSEEYDKCNGMYSKQLAPLHSLPVPMPIPVGIEEEEPASLVSTSSSENTYSFHLEEAVCEDASEVMNQFRPDLADLQTMHQHPHHYPQLQSYSLLNLPAPSPNVVNWLTLSMTGPSAGLRKLKKEKKQSQKPTRRKGKRFQNKPNGRRNHSKDKDENKRQFRPLGEIFERREQATWATPKLCLANPKISMSSIASRGMISGKLKKGEISNLKIRGKTIVEKCVKPGKTGKIKVTVTESSN